MAKFEKVEAGYIQRGRNLNVKVGEEVLTITGDKEKISPAKEAIDTYNAKPTQANYKAMMELLKPVTADKEKLADDIKARIKSTKNKIKEEEKVEGKKKTKANVTDVVKDIEDKEYTSDELDKMERAIQAQKAKKQTQAQTTTRRPGSGEW